MPAGIEKGKHWTCSSYPVIAGNGFWKLIAGIKLEFTATGMGYDAGAACLVQGDGSFGGDGTGYQFATT